MAATYIRPSNIVASGGWYNAQNAIWTGWVTTGSTTTTIRYTDEFIVRNNVVWNSWTGNATGGNLYAPLHDEIWAKWTVRDQQIPAIAEFASEERRRWEAERQAQRDADQARREAASRRRLAAVPLLEKAGERAEELLNLVLTPEERLYRENNDGRVLVRGPSGQLYIVDTRYKGVHGNVWETDEHGCKLATLCVAPQMVHKDEHGDQYSIPLADGYVGQILSIKGNEEEFRRKANFSYRRECTQPNVPILGQQAA